MLLQLGTYIIWEVKITGFPGGALIKNPPANAGDARDIGSIPGSGRSRGEENGNPFQSSLAWRFPRTEELAADSPRDPKESDMTV